MTLIELNQLAEVLTPAKLHRLIIAMINLRMDAPQSHQHSKDMAALTEACDALELAILPY